MKIKVLVIDDSRTIRALLTETLSEAGFDVVSAEDGQVGVEKYLEVSPNAVITDLNMPRLDGFGVIRALRGGPIATKVPILVLTTESSDAVKARVREAGATGWIGKPFDDEQLLFALKRVTGVAA